jgi:hypothetical protein
MPIRGESVGTAYVRVVADGTGIPEDIRRAFNDTDRVYDDAGNVGAKRYKQAFADEMESHTGRSLDDALNDAFAKNDFSEEFFKSAAWTKFEKNMHARFGTMGDDAARSLKTEFLKKGSLDGLERAVEGVVGRVNNDVDKIIATRKRAAEQAEVDAKRTADQFERDLRRSFDDTDTAARRAAQVSVDASKSVSRAWESVRKTQLDLVRGWESISSRIKKTDKDVRDSATVFGRLGHTIDSIALKTGQLFGKGSRNNFLNFTGSFISGAVGLLSLPVKILDNLGQFVNGFRAALSEGLGPLKALSAGFKEMSKDADGAAQAGTGFLSSLGSIIIAAPVVVAALLGIVAVLGLVASLASSIVGILVALAGSVAFAVVGAIAPLAGLLAPVGIAIGVIVAGVATLDSKTKTAITKAIKPLTASIREMGGVARTAFLNTLFDTTDSAIQGGRFKNLDDLVKRMQILRPLFRAVGRGLGDFTQELLSGFQSKTFDNFVSTMSTFIPEVFRRLGRIVSNVGGIFANLFIDTVPSARSFLGWLQQITREFDNFLRDHPNKVKHFLDDAADSAHSLGDFLGAAARLLGSLLGAGRSTGNSIFDSLAKNIDKFNNFLNPPATGHTVFDEAAGGIRRFQDNAKKVPATSPLDAWFKESKQVADNLGQIVVGLGKIFDALDSPEGRKNLNFLLDQLTKIAALAGPLELVASAITDMLNPIASLAEIGHSAKSSGLVGFLDGIARSVSRLNDIRLPNLNLGKRINSLFSGLDGPTRSGSTLVIHPPNLDWIPSASRKVGHFFSSITGAADNVSFSSITHAASGTVSHINSLFGGVPGHLLGLSGRWANVASVWAASMLSRISDIPGEIVDFFRGLGANIANAIGSIGLHFDFPDPPSWLGKLGGGLGALKNRLTATGGIFDGAQMRVIAEAGAEAVVPLTGPLSAVDPSVRALAAIARGLTPTGGTATVTPGRTVNVEQNITTVATDPVAAAHEFLNHLTAVVA